MFWPYRQACGSQFKTRIQLQFAKDGKIVKLTNSRDMWTQIETQTGNNSAETRRNEIQTEMINVISMQHLSHVNMHLLFPIY